MRMQNWLFICTSCEHKFKDLKWDYELESVKCPQCNQNTQLFNESTGSAPGVVQDSIEGGIEIRHGICNPDGTPKRYYSKTEMKRAANEAGYTIAGDTPKPYRVNWSGKQKRIDGIKD